MQISRTRYCFFRYGVFLFCALASASCGMVGNPKPINPEAPPEISDLEAMVRPGAVELMWSIPAGDNVNSYVVRRSRIRWEDRECGTCSPIGQDEVHMFDRFHPEPAVAANGKMVWEDRNVNMSGAYRYRITVTDRKGHILSASNQVVVKILPPPPRVEDLRAEPGRQGIGLQWKSPRKGKESFEEIRYVLERRQSGGLWEKVSPVPITGDSFTDSAIRSKQVYDYRVSSLIVMDGVNILGESATIQHVEAPDAIPPPPPTTVWALLNNGAVQVQWTESGGVAGYHVYRRGESGEIVRLTDEPIKHPPFDDSNVQANALYFYAVSAVGSDPHHREGMVSKWIEIRNGAVRF